MCERKMVSCCMIVRDNERTIRAAIESIHPYVDDLVVVDTGSVDATPEIVKSYGARLFHFSWIDDFSAARNFSIEQALGEWIFWMDSDDTLPPHCGQKLKELARAHHRDKVLGYVMQVQCPSDGSSGITEFTVVDHVKLFRNRKDLRFEGPIHEQILMPIRRAKGEVLRTDIYVVHSGSEHTPESQRRKVARDLRILFKDLANRPNHPFVLFNLAMTYAESGQHSEGLQWIERCLSVSAPHESHVPKAFSYLASCQAQLGMHEQSLQSCRRGRELFPDDAELRFREATSLYELKRLDESIDRYREIMSLPKQNDFQSTDPSISGYKCRFNLGISLRDALRLDEAEFQFRAILREKPTYTPAIKALFEVLIQNKRLTTARVEAEKLISDERTETEGILALVKISEVAGDLEDCRQILLESLQRFPDNIQLLEEASRFHFKNSAPEITKEVLQGLLKHYPDSPAARHNLGAIHFQLGEIDQAIGHLLKSLHLRPDNLNSRRLFEAIRQRRRALKGELANPTSDVPVLQFKGTPDEAAFAARIVAAHRILGNRFAINCTPDAKIHFKAMGIGESDQPGREWELFCPPYDHSTEATWAWEVNHAGWNLNVPPFVANHTEAESWRALCNAIPKDNWFDDEVAKKRVREWLLNMPRPLIVYRSNRDEHVSRLTATESLEFRQELVKRVGGTLVIVDRQLEHRLDSAGTVYLSDLEKSCPRELELAAIEQADLCICDNSDMHLLSGLFGKPTVTIWTSGRHPAREALPSRNQINVVLADRHGLRQPRWRTPWNIIECERESWTADKLVDCCLAMLNDSSYLGSSNRAADVQMQYWISSWCHEEGIPIRDRERSFDALFKEISCRFQSAVIVETGTIRKAEDWSGAGYFTYLAAFYCSHVGGKLYSVDTDPANCRFAQKVCLPFDGHVDIACGDSVSYLRQFGKAIDVLYCDSLDTYETGFEEHAFNEVQAAMVWLSPNALIVLDDSPTIDGNVTGKGTKAVPWLLDQGWKILFAGYQIILARG